ncbi:hypothetical protein ACLBWV_03840 [Microbacterium paraoxydans]
MTSNSNGVEDADEGTEASENEQHDRRNLERRATGRIDGRSAKLDPTAGDEPPGRVHRLHSGSDGDGDGDSLHRGPGGAASVQQVSAEFTLRQSPWLPPDELKAYYETDPDFARGIIETIQSAQQARVDAELIPIRAEAWALKVATVGVTFLPWIAAGIAVVFALQGLDTAALISGIFSVATGGAQILHAVRRPTVVQQVVQQSPTPAKPKPSQATKNKKSNANRKKKRKR